jgi:virulence factor Mce-like protein
LTRQLVRPLTGLATVLAIGSVIAVATLLFRGSLTHTEPVTVMTSRAGLVMNPDAKVKMRGVQVGAVSSIEALPDGQAAIHLAMDPSQLGSIPDNVRVDVASSTVFGAKFVALVAPVDPSPEPLRPGQILAADRVTVEVNTVFQQLTSVLSSVQPDKLNETLGAAATALHGRGGKFGQTIRDLDAFFASVEPALPNLNHDLEVIPTALNSFADAAPDLVRMAENASVISRTVVEEQGNLDELLISVVGLGDVGNDVLTASRQPLTDALRNLAPVTDLTKQYEQALYCGVAGLLPLALSPRLKNPGVGVLASFMWGQERWRYPDDLPKVAATGGPQCTNQPRTPYGATPPFVVADTGANPFERNNSRLLWNTAGVKEALYGPLPGPPRNSGQVGMPG